MNLLLSEGTNNSKAID